MKKIQNVIITTIVFSVILLIINGCAQEMMPTGGPKDTQPPVVMKSKPEQRKTNFSDRYISIDFDEFVVLKDASSQILISPPITPKPTFSTRGKSVVIDLKNSQLQPNTTYNIFFGDAVQDLHEGNIIQDLHYVFSTGATVDSMSYNGRIINAFDNTPAENVSVMLYPAHNDTIPMDSLPYRVLPRYICRTQKEGTFCFENIDNQSYKIFALKDENRNLLYDFSTEMMAFSDTLVVPYLVTLPDSTDSMKSHQDNSNIPLKMLLFNELDTTLTLKELKIIDSAQAQWIFSYRVEQPSFRLLTPDSIMPHPASICVTQNVTKDTITTWFPMNINDTLRIEWSNYQQVYDTVEVVLKSPTRSQNRSRQGGQSLSVEPTPSLTINSNASSSFPFFKTLNITTATPLTDFRQDGWIFVVNQDTVSMPPVIAAPNQSSFAVDYTFNELTNYKLEIPQGAFTDIFGRCNDTTQISFTTDESTGYGSLKLQLTLPQNCPPVVIQLLSEDGKRTLQEQRVEQSVKVDFGYLSPQKVQIKAIFDENANGWWDTGDYLRHIQPERTAMFPKTIEIRAYWDAEEQWELEW